jgi:hypothetical protein
VIRFLLSRRGFLKAAVAAVFAGRGGTGNEYSDAKEIYHPIPQSEGLPGRSSPPFDPRQGWKTHGG